MKGYVQSSWSVRSSLKRRLAYSRMFSCVHEMCTMPTIHSLLAFYIENHNSSMTEIGDTT